MCAKRQFMSACSSLYEKILQWVKIQLYMCICKKWQLSCTNIRVEPKSHEPKSHF